MCIRDRSNTAREHGTRPVNTGVIFDTRAVSTACEHGLWTRVVYTELNDDVYQISLQNNAKWVICDMDANIN